jgi:hypothetical protein
LSTFRTLLIEAKYAQKEALSRYCPFDIPMLDKKLKPVTLPYKFRI